MTQPDVSSLLAFERRLVSVPSSSGHLPAMGLNQGPNSGVQKGARMAGPEWWGQNGGARMVGEAGFEPAKAVPSDLQSDPFGRSGIPPSG